MLPYTQLMKNNFVTCLARITLENKHSMLQMLSQTCHLCNHTSFLHRHVRGHGLSAPSPLTAPYIGRKVTKSYLGKILCTPRTPQNGISIQGNAMEGSSDIQGWEELQMQQQFWAFPLHPSLPHTGLLPNLSYGQQSRTSLLNYTF